MGTTKSDGKGGFISDDNGREAGVPRRGRRSIERAGTIRARWEGEEKEW